LWDLKGRVALKRIGKGRVGLALGGGAVLGAAHLGVLKALDERGIPIGCISGTSVGAIIAAFYAFGMGWREIEDAVGDMNWLDVSRVSISQYGLLSNSKLGEMLIDNIGDVSFHQSTVPLAVIATDISSGEKVVLKEGNVAAAVTASSCIPGIFIPVEIGGRTLVDGGIVENVPITPLQDMGADFIIAVDLNSERRDEKPRNIIEVLLRSFYYLRKSATSLQTEKADLVIQPDLTDFNMYDMNQANGLFDAGYLESIRMLEKIR